jgi:hypothetical protein
MLYKLVSQPVFLFILSIPNCLTETEIFQFFKQGFISIQNLCQGAWTVPWAFQYRPWTGSNWAYNIFNFNVLNVLLMILFFLYCKYNHVMKDLDSYDTLYNTTSVSLLYCFNREKKMAALRGHWLLSIEVCLTLSRGITLLWLEFSADQEESDNICQNKTTSTDKFIPYLYSMSWPGLSFIVIILSLDYKWHNVA